MDREELQQKARDYSGICSFCDAGYRTKICTECENRGKYYGYIRGVEDSEKDEVYIRADQREKDMKKAWQWIMNASSKFPIMSMELPVLEQSFKNFMEE